MSGANSCDSLPQGPAEPYTISYYAAGCSCDSSVSANQPNITGIVVAVGSPPALSIAYENGILVASDYFNGTSIYSNGSYLTIAGPGFLGSIPLDSPPSFATKDRSTSADGPFSGLPGRRKLLADNACTSTCNAAETTSNDACGAATKTANLCGVIGADLGGALGGAAAYFKGRQVTPAPTQINGVAQATDAAASAEARFATLLRAGATEAELTAAAEASAVARAGLVTAIEAGAPRVLHLRDCSARLPQVSKH